MQALLSTAGCTPEATDLPNRCNKRPCLHRDPRLVLRRCLSGKGSVSGGTHSLHPRGLDIVDRLAACVQALLCEVRGRTLAKKLLESAAVCWAAQGASVKLRGAVGAVDRANLLMPVLADGIEEAFPRAA